MKGEINKSEHIKKALLDALEKTLGNVTQACKLVDVSRTTFYEYMKEDDFADKVADIEQISHDYVESKLFKQIEKENMTGIIFYLKTKGKSRGYIERHEIDHKNHEGIRVEIIDTDQDQ
jgi:phage antirepressor YoqD-like protein